MSAAKHYEQIRDDYLRDLQNSLPAAHIHAGSDNYVRATAIGVAAEGIYQHQNWLLDQIFADTAAPENLERHAAELGIVRKAGTFAAGRIRLHGQNGASVSEGTAVSADGKIYRTSDTVRIGGNGSVEAAAVSDGTGTQYNLPPDTPLTVLSAPSGVLPQAQILSMTGGSNPESDASLLARYLYRKRKPAAGGNRHDYYVWAMEVPGVAEAFVYPLRRGLGTVDVAVIGSDGLPSEHTVRAVQQHIDNNRPVTAKNVLVLAPTVQTVQVRVGVKVAAEVPFAEVRSNITEAVRKHFSLLKPGSPLIKSQLESAVSQVYGVIDRNMTLPAANIEAAADESGIEWLRVGNITVEQTV